VNPSFDLPSRYVDLGIIGEGATCHVLRVTDTRLDCELAMKVLRQRLIGRRAVTRKFHDEARLTARLRHPGIPPVHDLGVLEDGRLWFTMALVEGDTLRQCIARHHAACQEDVEPQQSLRDLLEMLHAMAEAVGYAHSEGVVHRDLKPSNVMLGAFSEVRVMDWGIARTEGVDDELTGEAFAAAPSRHRTMIGKAIGTPSYMPPEQARGDNDAVGAWSDVYALGACLYKLLSGRSPYRGSPRDVVMKVRRGPPAPLADMAWRALDPELIELCEWAMSRRPERRPQSGRLFAQALRAWLDHEQRRARAEAVLEGARQVREQILTLEHEQETTRRRLERVEAGIQSWEPLEQRRPLWELRDRLDEIVGERRRLQVDYVKRLRAALAGGATLPEARRALADVYQERAREAEQAGDPISFATAAAQLGSVDDGTHADWLAGKAYVSLTTDPPGAVVEAVQQVRGTWDMGPSAAGRRLLGETPLHRVELAHGSWLLSIRCPGHQVVTQPVSLGRLEHQRLRRPADEALTPIVLPPEGSLAQDECYVPAGWAIVGGEGLDTHPQTRVWIDGFIIQRDRVTVEQFAAFVQDRLHLGATVEGLVPDAILEVRDGRVVPRVGPQEPMREISWRAARAYARWRREVEGRPWRLPHEYEWEKAARGVDGRPYPWGYRGDPVLAAVLGSGADYSTPPSRFPHDVSVYGVRGAVGGLHEFTNSPYTKEPLVEGRAIEVQDERQESSPYVVVRGGNVSTPRPLDRVASRWAMVRDRAASFGFRLVRSVTPG